MALKVTPPPLTEETRAAVDTPTAAHHLSRTGQTLRRWASRQNGPLNPVRMGRRLMWRTDDIRSVLGASQ